jgi:hypothetical protein
MTDVPRVQRRWVTYSDELASTARTRGRYAVVAVPQRSDQGWTLRLPGAMCATLAAQAYGQRSDVWSTMSPPTFSTGLSSEFTVEIDLP